MRLLVSASLFLTFLLASVIPCQAQRRGSDDGIVIRAYPSLGVTASQIEGDYLKGFKKWGFTAGVGAQLYLGRTDRWSLSMEADFAQRGASEYNHGAEVPYNIKGMTLDYIDVPLTFHFTDPWGGITVGVGLVYSRLIRQPHGTLSFSPTYVEPDTTDLTFLRNDLAVAGDIRFTVWRNLMLNLRMQYSIIPVKRNWTFVEHTSANDSNPPIVTVNDCYNFSVAVRLIYMLGDAPEHHSNNKSVKGRRQRR